MAEKEALLRLRLLAQNEANPAFEAAAKAMSELTQPAESASKAVSDVSTEFRAMMDTIRSASASMGDAGKSFESITQSSSGISKSFGDDEKVILDLTHTLQGFENALKDAAATINDTSHSFEAITQASSGVSKAFMDDQKAIGDVTQSLNGFDRALNDTSQSMRGIEDSSQAFTRASTNAHTLEDSVSKGGLLLGLQQLGQSMEDIGGKGDELFKGAIESAAEFEANISRIHAVLMNREPTANMEAMKEAALKLGSDSKFSANQIAEGMYDLARQGLSSTQILGDGVNGAIEVVNNLAQSTDTAMSETAKVVTDVIHEFGLSGDQLSKVGDLISGTMHTSSISMNDLYYSMRQVGPVASNMHQSIDDVSTAIALLAQHGISGSSAGTALKNMLLGLEPRTAKAAELMKDLGISAKNGAADSFYQLNGNLKPLPDIIGVLHDKFGDLNDSQKQAALSATFTKYGLAGLNTIVAEGKDKFEALKKTLSDEKSADIAREKMNNLQGDIWRLQAATATMAKSFGDTLEPAMRGIASSVQGVITWFTNLSPSTKQTIMIVGGVASAMTVVGGAILSAVSAIGFLSMGFEGGVAALGAILGPIGLVAAAVAVLGVGAYELYTHWGQVKTVAQQLMSNLVSLKNEALDKVKTAFDDVKKFVDKVKDSFVKLKDEAVQAVEVKIKSLTDTINAHKTAIEVTSGILGTIFGPALIKSGVEAAAAGGKIAIEFTANAIKLGTEAVTVGAKLTASFIANIVTSGVEAVTSGARITASFIASIIQTGAEAVVAGAKLTAGIIASTIELGVQTAITSAKITGQAIVALVTYAAQGWTTAAAIAGQTAALVANAAAFVAQKVALVASSVATGALTAAQWLLNTAFWANPATWVIAGIVALGVAIYEIIVHWKDIVTWVGKAWDKLKDFGDEALKFGKNFVKMVADGILEGIKWVEDSVTKVADKLKAFLGFHSPTEEGPASDSDKWAPNFVKMFANGISDGSSEVGDAAKTLISPLADSFTALSGGTKFDAETMGSTIQLIINAKKDYADAAAKNDQTAMDSAHQMADEYRKNLESMGVNSKLFSQDTSVDDCLKNLQMVSKQSTSSTSNDYSIMTSGVLSNNASLSSDTLSSTNNIAKSWTDTRNATVQVVMDLGNSLKAIFGFIQANATNMCSTVQTTFHSAFQSIANDAVSAMNRVVSAMMSMRAAMASANAAASMGGGNGMGQMAQSVPHFAEGGKVTKPTLAMVGDGGEPEYIVPESKLTGQNGYTMGLVGVSLPGGIGGTTRTGQTVINGGINIMVSGVGKDGKQIGNDIMSILRREFKFAL